MGDQKIQVAVRARPMNQKEIDMGNIMVWNIRPPNLIELEDDGRTPTGKSWNFDCVFQPGLTTKHVFEKASLGIVEGALNGFNGTFFAYGQTSSGKTFTLMGNPKTHPGVTPLSITTVFQWIEDHPETDFDINIGYIEIYNETVTDLLDPDEKACKNKKVIEDKQFGPNVKDLVEVRAVSPQHCLDTLAKGEGRRSFAFTEMNANSSRSHTLFRMRIESRVVDEDKQSETKNTIQSLASTLVKSQQAISADRASLYLVDRDNGELYIQAGEITLRIPIDKGLAGACATKGEKILIPDAYKDKRFSSDVDKSTGYLTKSILCLPIKNMDEIVVGVAQFINKMPEGEFTEDDVDEISGNAKLLGELISAAQSNARTMTMSRLNLVDLAGSERQDKTGATGDVLKEANNINKSLMVLGTCINILSEGKKGEKPPFRSSILTRLLSTSLGGNTRTCIFCAFSPALRNRAETISTLNFGNRAKTIATTASKNTKKDEGQLLSAMENEIQKLKNELEKQKKEAEILRNMTDDLEIEDDASDDANADDDHPEHTGPADGGGGAPAANSDSLKPMRPKKRRAKPKVKGPVLLVISDEAATDDGAGRRNRAISVIDGGAADAVFTQDPEEMKDKAREFSQKFAVLRDECAEAQETSNRLQPYSAPKVTVTAMVALTTHNLSTQELVVSVMREGSDAVQWVSEAQFGEMLGAIRRRDEDVKEGKASGDWYFPNPVFTTGAPHDGEVDDDIFHARPIGGSTRGSRMGNTLAVPGTSHHGDGGAAVVTASREEDLQKIEYLEKKLADLQQVLESSLGSKDDSQKEADELTQLRLQDLDFDAPSRQESLETTLQDIMHKFHQGSRERMRGVKSDTSALQLHLQRLEEIDNSQMQRCGNLLKEARTEVSRIEQDSTRRRLQEIREPINVRQN